MKLREGWKYYTRSCRRNGAHLVCAVKTQTGKKYVCYDQIGDKDWKPFDDELSKEEAYARCEREAKLKKGKRK